MKVGQRLRNHPKSQLAIFIIIALASGWFGLGLNKLIHEPPGENNPGMGLLLALPLLTALLLRFITRDWYGFGIKPRFSGNFKWYLFAIAVFPVVTILVTGIAWLFNMAEMEQYDTGVFLPLMAFSLLPGLVMNIFEEFSWRGFLTPKLIGLKLNDGLIYVIVGLVWALWHAPYYLYLMPDAYFEIMSRGAYVWMGCIIMVCWAIMFVELYRITRSVWPCVFMHALQDAVPNLLMNNVSDGGVMVLTKGSDLWLNPTDGIVTTILIVVLGLWLRFVRIKKEQNKNIDLKRTISI